MALLLDLISQYGLVFIFFCVLVEQAGAPIPAYPVLLVTGALAARGEFALPALLTTAVIACLIADSAWYAAGQRVGTRVLRLLCRISLSPESCVRQTESLFARWGAPSLMVAKFVPGFASVATAMAGSTRVPWPSFLFLDAIGAALWAGTGLALGWLFSSAIEDVLLTLEAWGRWGLALIATALVFFVAAKWWQRYRFRQQLRMDRMSVLLISVLAPQRPRSISSAHSPLDRQQVIEFGQLFLRQRMVECTEVLAHPVGASVLSPNAGLAVRSSATNADTVSDSGTVDASTPSVGGCGRWPGAAGSPRTLRQRLFASCVMRQHLTDQEHDVALWPAMVPPTSRSERPSPYIVAVS